MIYIDPTHIHLYIKPTILIVFAVYHFHPDQTLMDEGGEPSKDMAWMMFPMVWYVV